MRGPFRAYDGAPRIFMAKYNDNASSAFYPRLGEYALFKEIAYKTMTKCTIMYLSVSKVLNTCRNNCPFHRRLIINLFDCVTRKNAMLIRKIDIVSRNTIRGKIMAYLQEVLRLTNEIPLNKMEMAQYLSVNRSALARELSAMKQDGLIDFNGSLYTIL